MTCTSKVAVGLLMFVSSCPVSWGQAVSQVNGNVTDPSGAVIPNGLCSKRSAKRKGVMLDLSTFR